MGFRVRSTVPAGTSVPDSMWIVSTTPEACAARSRDEWAELFAESDACVTPVLTPWEAAGHPHNAARGTFTEVHGHVHPAPAPRFSRPPAADPPQPARVVELDDYRVEHWSAR